MDYEYDEVWAIIDEFKDYMISSYGRIWSVKKKRILSPSKGHHAWRLGMYNKHGVRKSKFVHRLVAEAFMLNPDPDVYTQINHKDEDTANNRVENLEWCTPEYNCNYGTRNKRMGEGTSKALKNHPAFSKRVRCLETGVEYVSIRDAAKKTGFSTHHIYESCKGHEFKRADNKHWIYI